jgi:hypothetical protein
MPNIVIFFFTFKLFGFLYIIENQYQWQQLAVYSGHATLRYEYSIFLISAAGGQLFYGISYILLIFSDDKLAVKKLIKSMSQKSITKNL